MSIYIIAEAGVNHNGSFETACRLVDAAKTSGADCIKFQTFRADRLVSKFAQKAEYQKESNASETQQEMLRKLELSYEEFRKLKDYCSRAHIDFLSTPFDFESIEFLNTISMPFWKIPSGEVTNLPYLIALAKTEKPVVMSTGMCTLEEVAQAVDVLETNGADQVILMHCNTEYPTPFEDVNFKAMRTLHEATGLDVGYSDHTLGIEAPIAAAALGACMIEKHFTLDTGMEGPDHKASLDPQQFAAMVKGIRHIEAAMGSGEKQPSPSERKNITVARKSITAKRRIRKGEIFSEDNITVKRPGTGISPMRWFEVLGKEAVRDFQEDELITL